MRIGDGLNDQIALNQSNIGIAITDNVNGFYPSSDGILIADQLKSLPQILSLSRYARFVLKTSLAFSVFYILIGVSFAVAGSLTPIVAAILMPLSSITVVGLVTALVSFKAKKLDYTDNEKLKDMISAEMFDLFDKPELADKIRMTPPPQPSPMQVQMEQLQLQEQMLKNQLLQVQIQTTQMDSQSGAVKAQASMEGATNGRISATSKSTVDKAKVQETSVNTALRPVEALANLNKGNTNGNKTE